MRLAVLVVLAGLLTAAPAADPFDARVQEFERHWDRFIRALWGCRPEDASRAACRPELGQLDRREYDAARKGAMRLFDLKER